MRVAGNPKAERKNPIKHSPTEVILLENRNGIVFKGVCPEQFSFTFAPHYGFHFSSNNLQLEIQGFDNYTKKAITTFHQKCKKGNNFIFVAVLEDEKINFSWTIVKTEENGGFNGSCTEFKSFMSPKLAEPLFAIQTHLSKKGSYTIESKNFQLRKLKEERCEFIRNKCSLGGKFGLEDCFLCAAKAFGFEPCFEYVKKNKLQELENSEGVSGQSESDSIEIEIQKKISIILNHMKKLRNPHNYFIESSFGEEALESLEETLIAYCNLLIKVDDTGTSEKHKLGTYKHIYANIKKILDAHDESDHTQIRNKLRNIAICLEDANEWTINRRGLLLPDFYELEEFIRNTDTPPEPDTRNIYDSEKNEEEINVHVESIIDESAFPVVGSLYYHKSKYCTNEYCNRWNDKTSCFARIEAQDQGECGICWIYSTMLHLETLRCMRGYGPLKGSTLYVVNCSQKDRRLLCRGGNSFQFLKIARHRNYIPIEKDYPYSFKSITGICPDIQRSWTNIWGKNTRVLRGIYRELHHVDGFNIYLSSDYYRDRLQVFINAVKKEIQNKGSAIVLMKAYGVLSFELDGRKVLSLCAYGKPDHAMTVIGYGNYIDRYGRRSSYWIIRNSWGYYWGDEGTFKLDMYGPRDCPSYAIHSVFTFKINLGEVGLPQTEATDGHSFPFPEGRPDWHSTNTNPYDYFSMLINMLSPLQKNIEKEADLNASPDLREHRKEPEAEVEAKGEIDVWTDEDSDFETNVEAELARGERGKPTYSGRVDPTFEEEHRDNSKPIKIKHVIEDIMGKQVIKRVIKYDSQVDAYSLYSCSRIFGVTNTSNRKQEECKKFCLENFYRCKNHKMPGYCLMKLGMGSDCFFCSV